MIFYLCMVPQPGLEPGKAWLLKPLGVPISTSHRGIKYCMSFFVLQDQTALLYKKFSDKPYVPSAFWTTNRSFKLDPLYQQSNTLFVPDQKPEVGEFVLETSLVPPPGNDPGSSNFQSVA